jgi:hypothetical protein
MKFTRRKRIALEVLGPPALGAALFLVCALGIAAVGPGAEWPTWPELKQLPVWVLTVLLFAYFFAGLPSLIYAAIMELAFARGLTPGGGPAIVVSAVLGLASGVGMALFLGWPHGRWDAALLLGGVGFGVGLTIGLIVRWTRPLTVDSTLMPASGR